MRADGSGKRRLTRVPVDNDYNSIPRWSPDGKQIAFVHLSPDVTYSLWLVRADGTHAHAVTHAPCSSRYCAREVEPSWSPDGKRIVFVRASTISVVAAKWFASAGNSPGRRASLSGLVLRRQMDRFRSQHHPLARAPQWVWAAPADRGGAWLIRLVAGLQPHRLLRWPHQHDHYRQASETTHG
jgi:Tol biopolymer transport system component